MIKKWSQFEALVPSSKHGVSIDEDDLSLCRMEFSGCVGFIYFQFRSLLIRNNIKHLIDFYLESRERNGGDGGGMVNKEFDNYFKKQFEMYLYDLSNKPYRPSIGLIVETQYGNFHMSFSLTDYKPFSTTLRLISKNIDPSKDIINISRVKYEENSGLSNDMMNVWNWLYYKNMTLSEVIDYLNINISDNDIIS